MRSCKHMPVKLLIGLVLGIAIMTPHVFPVVVINHGGLPYTPSDGKSTGLPSTDNPIESCIARGGAYFLSGYSDYLAALNRIESGLFKPVDMAELKTLCDKAISNIQNACYYYNCLVQAAGATPYNNDMILQLAAFDYTSCMEQNNLNPVIFGEVESYLEKGDVTGLFKNVQSSVSSILINLKSFRQDVLNGTIPAASKIWSIGDSFSRAFAFGAYSARVFQSLEK